MDTEQALVERVFGYLLAIAVRRATTTYTELAAAFGFNLSWQADRARLGGILGTVSDRSHGEWGILISALVVGKGDNLPSGRHDADDPSGFYSWAARYGRDLSDPYKLAVDEQRKVYNHVAKLS